MRAKTLWSWMPLPEMIKLVYKRVTLTPYTTFYFFTALILCVTQFGLQFAAHSINESARFSLSAIIQQSGVDRATNVFAVLDTSNNDLLLCNDLPGDDGLNDPCVRVSDFAAPADDDVEKRAYYNSIEPLYSAVSENIVGVTLTGYAGTDETVSISAECVASLHYPVQILHDSEREDLTFAGYQVWLLAMIVIGIINESIPHIIASLISLVLSTAWAAAQISRSVSFRQQFTNIITETHCEGVDLLPGYWGARLRLEAPILALDVLALVIITFLSWKLLKIYGWETFKRIGGSPTMKRAYLLVLNLTIFLQLSALFLLSGTILWIDEIWDGYLAAFASHAFVYRPVGIVTVLLVVPWFIVGWVAVRQESKKLTWAFLGMSGLFIASHAAMFASRIFRFAVATWPFFAIITVAAFLLLLIVCGLTIMCMMNFNLGLARFLEGTFYDDRADRTSWTFQEKEKMDLEKVPIDHPLAFPSLPTLPYYSQPKLAPPQTTPPRRASVRELNSTPEHLRIANPSSDDEDVLFDLPVTPTRAATNPPNPADHYGNGLPNGSPKRNTKRGLWSIVTNLNGSSAPTGAPQTAAYTAGAYSVTTSGWFDRDAVLAPPLPVATNLGASFTTSPQSYHPTSARGETQPQLDLPPLPRSRSNPSPVAGEKNRFT